MSLQQWIVPGVVPNVLVLVICPVNIKLSIQPTFCLPFFCPKNSSPRAAGSVIFFLERLHVNVIQSRIKHLSPDIAFENTTAHNQSFCQTNAYSSVNPGVQEVGILVALPNGRPF